MEYKKFPIVDVARRCGIPLDETSLGQDEVLATCPFCGDNGRGKYHLGLNVEKDQYCCPLCGAHGNSVTLYAALNKVSNRQASMALQKDEKVYPMPTSSVESTRPKKYGEPTGVEERNAVYQNMLSFLTLSPVHYDDLQRRGLSKEQIKRNGYRSLPTSKAARRELADILSHFNNLTGIPGFYQQENCPGAWRMCETDGMLVPVRDLQGRIQGFQVRMNNADKRKYRWFSSKGYPGGTRSHAWVHIVGNRSADTAYLTEGGLKGDVASHLAKGRLFICIPGVNSLDYLPEVLKQLAIKKLVVCMDMDKVFKPNVQSALVKLKEILKRLHIAGDFPNWNPGFKGIDDYYLAWKAKGYRPQLYEPTPITHYLDEVWERQYPSCDREFIFLCDWEDIERPVADVECAMPTKDEQLGEIERYRQAIRDGAIPFPSPLVCINGDVAEGATRYWAWRMEGRETIRIYQNKPWQGAA